LCSIVRGKCSLEPVQEAEYSNHLIRVKPDTFKLFINKFFNHDLELIVMDIFAAIRGRGIYRSTDNGESWEEIITGLTYYNSLNELHIPKLGLSRIIFL
jgi:hypothetical protein